MRIAGDVHAYKLSGSRQLDTGEIARQSAYVYEPARHVDSWSRVGDEPCIVQIIMMRRVIYLGANGGELRNYINIPNLQKSSLAWCGKSGFEPIAIGAAE